MKNPVSNQFYRVNHLDGLSALDANIYQQSFPSHYHDTFQITLTKQGVFKNKINNKLIHAFKNQISITHPKEVHATVCDEKTGHNFFTLYLPPTLLESKITKNQSNPPLFKSVISDPVLARLLNQMQLLLHQNSPQIDWLTWQLINRLVQHHQTSKEKADDTQTLLDLSQLPLNQSKFNLDNWAQQFNLDKFKFMRLFKSQTGMTPNQYSIFQRIKKSQNLLAQGIDLTDCALEFGFYDLPHFHKHFKNITGVTPSTYQQAYC